MFSTGHILSIIASAISILFFLTLLKKYDITVSTKILKIIAIILFMLNPLNWAYEIIIFKEIDYTLNLPLHLCSIFWALFPFAIFLKKNSTFRQISLASCATIGIIGGILGLLLNSHLSLNPFFSFPVIRSMIFHYLMIFAALLLWTSKIYKPQKKDVYLNFIPIVILAFISIIVEAKYGYEYCYVRDGAGTPLTIISDILPRPIYILVVYSALFMSIKLIFYNKLIFKYTECR